MQLALESAEQTRVLIIDDHPFVLQGCARILEEADVARVLQSSGLADGYRQYRAHHPHVIIVDLSIKSAALGGLGFVRRLRRHDKKTPILVLSMHSDPMIIRRALEAGATGYLLKDAPSEEFLKAFHTVRQGRPYLSHEVASDIAFSETRANASPLHALTVRELQTLALIAEGKSYGVIADELSVSYKTVANSTSQIKVKLGARSLPELMRIAIQHLPGPSGRRSS
ncbi:response regulator transcription factor [Hyphomicrobium sp.]|uniref:response regulator transcription factor n=1 Tax=Hyphomicrobium sp. TaxID=82 RepID=UPI003D12B5E0